MLKKLIYKLLIPFSKLENLFHSKQLRVLAYHTVPDPVIFERQLRYLKGHYNVIGISDIIKNINSLHKLPQKSLLITFDDGDFSVYENGLTVLAKYDLPSVLFIISDLINSKKDFWWKQIERYFESEGDTYQNARKKINELKSATNKERELYLKGLPDFHVRQISTEQLLECQKKGMFI